MQNGDAGLPQLEVNRSLQVVARDPLKGSCQRQFVDFKANAI
jgi:hypothetical protein